jgi:Uncharacterized protein conserved in bacteria (DUF2332)
MPGAFALVPADALPVVTTTWALPHVPPEDRQRFLHRLGEAAAGRAVARAPAQGAGAASRSRVSSGMNSSRTNPRIHESFSSNSGLVEKSQAIRIPP